MLSVANRPLISYQLEFLEQAGFEGFFFKKNDFFFNIFFFFLKEMIVNYCFLNFNLFSF